MTAGIFIYLGDLCFSDLIGIDAAHTSPAGVYVQHDLCCLLATHTKKLLQYLNHEFHRGKIVIQQQYLKQWRPFKFRFGLLYG